MKVKIPMKIVSEFVDSVDVIEMSQDIVALALIGPTDDFEDNVQLYSAIEANAQVFLTHDKKLLRLKEFESLTIIDEIS